MEETPDVVKFQPPPGVLTRSYTVLPSGLLCGVQSENMFNSDDMSLKQMYHRMKHLPHTTPFSSPVAAAALDAVPVCMLVLGSSVSKKRDLFQGPYPGKEMLPVASQTETDAGEGIIGLLSNDLFEVLAANTNCPWGSNFAQWRCVVTVKFVEFHDELVTDLLRPSTNERIDDTTPCFRKAAGKDCGIAGTVVVTNDMHRGAYLQGATSQRVYSATDVARLVQEGRLRRDQYADVQASMDCAACYFELELHHLALSDRSECKPSPTTARSTVLNNEELAQGWKCIALSTISIIEVPSTHKLAIPREQLILREGSKRNRSLYSLVSCIDNLCKPHSTRVHVSHGNSQLASLLAERLGGNCLLLSLACADANDSSETRSATLQLQSKLGSIRQFPVSLSQTHVLGLVLRHRACMLAMNRLANDHHSQVTKSELVVREKNDDFEQPLDAPLSKRLHILERLLADSRLDTTSAREDSTRVYNVLELFKGKYTQLAEQKANQAKALIRAEQAKMDISRAFLESKLSKSNLRASSELDRYSSESVFLSLKDRAAELAIECEELRALKAHMQSRENFLTTELSKTHETSEKLRCEVARFSREEDVLRLEVNTEKARNIEISAELLRVAQQRDALKRSAQKHNEITRNIDRDSAVDATSVDAERRNRQLLKSANKMKAEFSGLQRDHASVTAELSQARVEAERALLDQDKDAAAILKAREAELAEARELVEESLQKLTLMKDAKEKNAWGLHGEVLAMKRRVSNLELALKRSKADAAQIKMEGNAMRKRCIAQEADYCARLDADLASALENVYWTSQDARPNTSMDSLPTLNGLVVKFVEFRDPLQKNSFSACYQRFVQSYREREGQLGSDVDNLRASQRLATARLKAALDHCDCLQDALTRHCPTKVKELKHEFGETLERAAGDLSEAPVPQTVEAERESYYAALDEVRARATLQQGRAIAAIRSLQKACKEKQERNDDLARQIDGLCGETPRPGVKPRASEETSAVTTRLEANRSPVVQGETETEPQRDSKEGKEDMDQALIRAKAHYDEALRRAEALKLVANRMQQAREPQHTSRTQIDPDRRRAKAGKQIATARRAVQRLHRDLELAALGDDSPARMGSSEMRNLSWLDKSSRTPETNSNPNANVRDITPKSTMALLGEAEGRCVQLAYRVQTLEEELARYREYMERTIRRYHVVQTETSHE